MTDLRPGMDHALYGFSPLPDRPALSWPGNAPLAGCVYLYLEHWDLQPDEGAVTDPRFGDRFGNFQPDYRTYTWREYGNRVGIFRLLEVLDRLDLKVTVAVNANACRRYPSLVERLAGRGYEFAVHGIDATQMITAKMSEDEERVFIATAKSVVEDTTGQRPVGWIGQDHSQSTRTPELLAAAGFTYCVDWPNDDQPYLMLPAKTLLSIPAQSEWDDVELLWHRRVLSPRFPGIVAEAIDCLREEAVRTGSGRYASLHLHPWLSGMPHRFAHVARALEIFAAADGMWQAGAGDVAAHALSRLTTDRSHGTAR